MDQLSTHKNKVTYNEWDSYEKIWRLADFERGPSLKILDAGSGSGLLDSRLRKFGHRVIEMDVYDRGQKQDFICCDIAQNWPVSEKSFDAVICTDVPEHLYDPVHVLTESARVLNSNGFLIFGVPNHFDLRQRLSMLFGKGIVHWGQLCHGERAWDYNHIRFFTLRDLFAMFELNSWHIETVQLNFMGGGIIPSRFVPKIIRRFLLKTWPDIFSGKFVVLAKPGNRAAFRPKYILVERTKPGM